MHLARKSSRVQIFTNCMSEIGLLYLGIKRVSFPHLCLFSLRCSETRVASIRQIGLDTLLFTSGEDRKVCDFRRGVFMLLGSSGSNTHQSWKYRSDAFDAIGGVTGERNIT